MGKVRPFTTYRVCRILIQPLGAGRGHALALPQRRFVQKQKSKMAAPAERCQRDGAGNNSSQPEKLSKKTWPKIKTAANGAPDWRKRKGLSRGPPCLLTVLHCCCSTAPVDDNCGMRILPAALHRTTRSEATTRHAPAVDTAGWKLDKSQDRANEGEANEAVCACRVRSYRECHRKVWATMGGGCRRATAGKKKRMQREEGGEGASPGDPQQTPARRPAVSQFGGRCGARGRASGGGVVNDCFRLRPLPRPRKAREAEPPQLFDVLPHPGWGRQTLWVPRFIGMDCMPQGGSPVLRVIAMHTSS